MAKVVLIGFMGAGKTTAARSLDGDGVDVDEVIEARLGRRIAEVFSAEGEARFREIEQEVTLELLDDPAVRVLALGGGAIGSRRVRDALHDHRVVWLDVEPEEAWRRVTSGLAAARTRPLAQDPERFRELLEHRRATYDELADVVVPATGAHRIRPVLDALEGLPARGVKMLWATTGSAEYPVYIGAGLLTRTRFWPALVPGRRVIVTDENVGRRYSDSIGPALAEIRIVPGEQSKTVAHAEIVWSELVRHGATRADVIAALGGGVVGDLAGFCAATYQRGVRVVQIPTTLVAQVDSSIGGKTGVDLPEAKNYVGAFHQPAAVLADPATLATLPAEELAAGHAEVIKTALVAGGGLWDRVRAGTAADDPAVIAGCALTKIRIVAADERDAGRRQLLNLGHTVGHAIETATGYARYRHGEAVALGLLAELRLAGADELRAEVHEMLEAARLPVTLASDLDAEAVVHATSLDKKRLDAGPVPFALCSAPGRVEHGRHVSPTDLRAAVRELQSR